jgi:nitrogen regulatory protein P-II 1
MKEIKAIIQPYMLDRVLAALEDDDNLPGVTISQVEGWGRSRIAEGDLQVQEAGHSFARKTKLEIVVADDHASQVVDLIARAARTGKPGDGKIFLYQVVDVLKIRSGERADAAL